MKSRFAILMVGGLLWAGHSSAAINVSGNTTGVTTYVWRGVKQNNGAALQSTLNLSKGRLSVGVWSSSVDFGGDIMIESDPYVEVVLASGNTTAAVGSTIYTYDMFETFNANAKYEIELYAKLGHGPVKFAGYLIPSQTSTEGQLNSTLFWTETSAGCTTGSVALSAMLAYGTYSSRSLAVPKKEATSFLVFTIGKNINAATSAFWSYQREIDKDMENHFYCGLSYNF
jgi:uncharacterized protein (TIGR02001 family)